MILRPFHLSELFVCMSEVMCSSSRRAFQEGVNSSEICSLTGVLRWKYRDDDGDDVLGGDDDDDIGNLVSLLC